MKHRRGTLYRRSNGRWVFKVVVAGKPIVRQLDDADGNPIKTRRAAEQARVALMASLGLTVANEVEALEAVTARLAVRKTELAQIEAARADEVNPPLRVRDAWQVYVKAPNRPDSGERTLAGYESQYERFAAWYEKRHTGAALRDVTEEDAAAYAIDLAASMAPQTYNKHVALLALVFRVLHKPARLDGNPFLEVGRKRAVARSRRELTVDELRRVCAAAEGELRALLAVGIYTGLRLGDCATLRWDEVDLVRGIVRRVPRKTARRHPVPVLVPIHAALAGILAETPEAQRSGYILPETAEAYLREDSSVTKRVQTLFAACGIETQTEGPGRRRAVVEVGFHSLRHTFVSLCRAADVPLSVVESIVGHSSPAMTRHYTHTGEAAARLAVSGLPTLAGAVGTSLAIQAVPAGNRPDGDPPAQPFASGRLYALCTRLAAVLDGPADPVEKVTAAMRLVRDAQSAEG